MLVAALPFYMHGSSAECNTLDVNINKIKTDKVRYDPSADAVISINVKNNSNEKISKKLNLDIFQNEKKVYSNHPLVFQYGACNNDATRTVYIDGAKVGKLNFYD